MTASTDLSHVILETGTQAGLEKEKRELLRSGVYFPGDLCVAAARVCYVN